eukprot:TRINITY_DN4270_c0_g1_i8.p2 TRINITY_DN4270_c0_g1~~TRINITY_DN4270_c0_g1_i8.p2  ORF type:complete len:193 (+),score=44.41 TRINITY_DN4270_c0_g1_i8:429-1007(+)
MYTSLIVYAVLCGVGWMIAGVLSILAIVKQSRGLVKLSFAIFIGLYTIFLFIFGSAWSRIKKVENDCPSYECKKYKEGVQRSARSFLGLSICALILILICALCTAYVSFYTHTTSDPNTDPNARGEASPYDIQAQIKANEMMNVQTGQVPMELPGHFERYVGSEKHVICTDVVTCVSSVSYTHLTLPTNREV